MLANHNSSKTAVLEVLFPNGAWRDLLGAILWEIVDRVPPGTVLLRVKKWFISFDITIEEFSRCMEFVFGPRSA